MGSYVGWKEFRTEEIQNLSPRYFINQIQGYEMGGACSTSGSDEKYIEFSSEDNLKWTYLSRDGRIILKRMLKR
jgi:hypothetical protein